VSSTGTRLRHDNVSVTFTRMVRQAGLAPRPGGARPRIHDARHYADGWVMRPAVAFPLAGAAELVLRSA
jgi:hypothetical protein